MFLIIKYWILDIKSSLNSNIFTTSCNRTNWPFKCQQCFNVCFCYRQFKNLSTAKSELPYSTTPLDIKCTRPTVILLGQKGKVISQRSHMRYAFFKKFMNQRAFEVIWAALSFSPKMANQPWCHDKWRLQNLCQLHLPIELWFDDGPCNSIWRRGLKRPTSECSPSSATRTFMFICRLSNLT